MSAKGIAATTVVMCHHTPDVYGSDLQMLESVSALVDQGVRVVVTVPFEGPLTPLVRERGGEVVLIDIPVLRKSSLTVPGLLRLAVHMARSMPGAVQLLRRERAAAVYVNTVTVPLWVVAAKLARLPVLCHVHEAQDTGPRALRAAIAVPLGLADRVLVNSEASLGALRESLPWAARRASVVYNGVPGPAEVAGPDAVPPGPARMAMVGRLSPRKGTDVALEATALLVARGYDVLLEVAGSVFPGYEWFEEELRRRADQPDLAGRVVLHGYLNPVWSMLARCRVVLVPSRTEPFGNAAVEGQLAGRPVVVAGVQGLLEIVTDGENGLVVPSEDAAALADAIARVLDDEALAQRLARSGRESAERRFGPATYRDHIASEMRTLVG